jgi:hypothetical protein
MEPLKTNIEKTLFIAKVIILAIDCLVPREYLVDRCNWEVSETKEACLNKSWQDGGMMTASDPEKA